MTKPYQVDVLTYRGVNDFQTSQSYESLREALKLWGFDKEYLDGRDFLLFTRPDADRPNNYNLGIWTPRGTHIIKQEDRGRLKLNRRREAFKLFGLLAEEFFSEGFHEGRRNTVITYPVACWDVKDQCGRALAKLEKSFDLIVPVHIKSQKRI